MRQKKLSIFRQQRVDRLCDGEAANRNKKKMGYLVDSSSHYILGVGVPALVASTIVL